MERGVIGPGLAGDAGGGDRLAVSEASGAGRGECRPLPAVGDAGPGIRLPVPAAGNTAAGAHRGRSTKGILVTGSHRSGSTWVGKMLDLSGDTYYLGEVFNPTSDLWPGPACIPSWFQYVTDDDTRAVQPALRRILDLDFRWPRRRGPRRALPSRLALYARTRRWLGWPRPLLKDPIAVFSSEWLARTFDLDVVCVIRHPAAFVASLEKVGWDTDLRQLTGQPRLMADWLHPLAGRLARPPESRVQRAALLWLSVYHVLGAFIDRNPGWLVHRLEDLSESPDARFEAVYGRLGLRFTGRVRERILEHSSARNPAEQAPGDPHGIRRDSRAAQRLWRGRLAADEVAAVRRIVEPVSHRYYTDADW